MKIFNPFLKIATIVVVIFGFTSCDDDFGTIGSNVVGENNFDALLYDEASVQATSYNLDAVQTNLLPALLLGVNNDTEIKTANVLTQLSLEEYQPSFGDNLELDSVILNIPYFRTRLPGIGENNEPLYELDSVYGDDPFKLTIRRSNYFLNEYDPSSNFEDRQKYYSDMQAEIENNLFINPILFDEQIAPSSEAILQVEGTGEDADTTYLPPSLRVAIDSDFFLENIINKEGDPELLNSNNFKNFIRGLYFQVEAIDDSGSMMLLDFNHEDAGIELHYTHQVPTVDPDDSPDAVEEEKEMFQISFEGIKFNLFENDFNLPEDDNLYIAGGAGSVTVLDLFTEEELEDLRANNWLINEANLTFFVNQDINSGGNMEPERIYLYDFNNNTPLIDYHFDVSSASTIRSKRNHLGPLKRDESGNGVSYKIRLTEHINNVLNNDSTNVRLGLVVAQSVDLISTASVKENEEIEFVPNTSILSPKGTVLYGPDAVNNEKNLKLRIHYTEPETTTN